MFDLRGVPVLPDLPSKMFRCRYRQIDLEIEVMENSVNDPHEYYQYARTPY